MGIIEVVMRESTELNGGLKKAEFPYKIGDKLVKIEGETLLSERELTEEEIGLLNGVIEGMGYEVSIKENKKERKLSNLKSENLGDLIKELDKVLERENKKPLIEIASRRTI